MLLEPHLTTYHSNMYRCPIKISKPKLSTCTLPYLTGAEGVYVLKRSWSLWGCQVAPNSCQLAQLCRQPVCSFSLLGRPISGILMCPSGEEKMQLMCDFDKSRAYWWSSLFGTRSSRVWVNQPTHFVPCWMPKPFPPRSQCAGRFAPTRLKGHWGGLNVCECYSGSPTSTDYIYTLKVVLFIANLWWSINIIGLLLI